ncbi:hypothetical protein AwDysgo_09350 [Bacteroidales bacterium]|nr:hypothetical protein AwDysgo_09350 [Bacteroidales bacterium]
MKAFCKNFIIFLIPFAIVCLIYTYFDPFKVIYHYDNYYEAQGEAYMTLNRDFVSSSNYENRYKKEAYNSFILGNSRSLFYEIEDWLPHLDKAKAYHFDASGETLYGIHKKIKYIDNRSKIENLLLILDHATLIQDEPKNTYLCYISPQLENNLGVKFQLNYLTTFFSPKFFLSYFDLKISKAYKPYMEVMGIDNRPMSYDEISNEIKFDYFENLILEEKYYTKDRMLVFHERTDSVSMPSIKKSQKKMLEDIADVLETHHTNVKIVINPLYDQIMLNSEDVSYLENLFGKKNVFDFSGINAMTQDYRNYYESSHYRPHIAREIIRVAYLKESYDISDCQD